ncbi:MAG: phospholipase D-like domain-containing protein, partial [Elusimicrobiota bacterium]|nr:phospholipase D-like domain-containing protein [Elusimicrobiota bacterium]
KASRKMKKFFDMAFGEYNDRIAFYSLLASQEIEGKPVYCDMYLHGKVGIFDDEWLTIGSANVNSFSMEKHSEMNVAIKTPIAGVLRRHLWNEHLGQDIHASTTPHDAFMLWAAAARATREAREMGIIPTARVIPFRPPYIFAPE